MGHRVASERGWDLAESRHRGLERHTWWKRRAGCPGAPVCHWEVGILGRQGVHGVSETTDAPVGGWSAGWAWGLWGSSTEPLRGRPHPEREDGKNKISGRWLDQHPHQGLGTRRVLAVRLGFVLLSYRVGWGQGRFIPSVW